MSDNQGDQGRSETTPYGQGSSSGPSSWSSGSHDQGSQDRGQHGQGSHDQGQYGQGSTSWSSGSYDQGSQDRGQYGQGSYDQGQYGQGQWGGAPAGYQQQYGQAGYGQPAAYGAPAPSRPGTVITAAVFGLVLGAGGVLVSLLLLFGATAARSLFDSFAASGELSASEAADLEAGSGAVTAVLVVMGLLALAWTVITIWGSIWALTGRSRVLLLVGGSISIAATGVVLLFVLIAVSSAPSGADTSGAVGGVLLYVVAFAFALLTVVLLSVRSAGQYFAAHRARRGRR